VRVRRNFVILILLMRYLGLLAAILVIASLVGCGRNPVVGTWQEDGSLGGQILITLRDNKTFTAMRLETGQEAVTVRIDGTYEPADGGVQLHPTGANFVSGNLETASFAYQALHGVEQKDWSNVFTYYTDDRAQMPYDGQTAHLHKIKNSDLPVSMTQEQIEFSQMAFARYQAFLANQAKIKRDNADLESKMAAERQNQMAAQQMRDQASATPPQQDQSQSSTTATVTDTPATATDSTNTTQDQTPPISGADSSSNSSGDPSTSGSAATTGSSDSTTTQGPTGQGRTSDQTTTG
jgi:hypothetical protein